MLIELETLSGSTGESLNFANGTAPSSPLTRPTFLPLREQPCFYPTLPSTPEIITRERSYCSLPTRPPAKCDLAKEAKTPFMTGVESRDEIDAKRDFCCSWFVSKWLRFLGKSSRSIPADDFASRSPRIKKCVSSSQLPVTTAVVTRRRAATIQSSTPFGQDNKREWGEERHNDVIYNVMLKRVLRAPSPSHTQADGKQWETLKVRQIKGATIGHLVSQLCQSFVDDWGEKSFLTVFFATYRSYTKPADVLEEIANECEKLKMEADDRKEQVLRSIRKVMRTWLERHFIEDFYDPPDFKLLRRIKAVVESVRENTGDDVNCEFMEYLRSKLCAAEVMSTQEAAIQNLNTPSHFSDIHKETEDISFDSEVATNSDAAKTLLTVFDQSVVAEQLTVKDANLFLRIIPHHCLKAVRSCREKPLCVRATIDQFNRVVYCVLGTCLCTSLKMSQRVKIICKWIEIAQQCRELKNFSSLRAIVSGLQTHAIHRLKKTWQHVPHTHTELLQEISQINMKDMIMKVGTAKVNTESSSISKVRKDATFRRQRAIDSGIMHGTVPYLGSFLTDLTYLHTAKPDYLENGLINFDKCRKEFEQLAQLQLWQASCKGYQHMEPDHRFNEWFNSVSLPSDEQANKLSEQIEPPSVIPSSPGINYVTPIKRSQSDKVFSLQGSGFDSSGNDSSLKHMRNSSDDSNDFSLVSNNNSSGKANGHVVAIDSQSDEERKINVRIVRKDAEHSQETSTMESKEMKLSSNDRTAAVVRNTLALFEMEKDSASSFSLVQLLSDDKELRIPDSSNVFYAMNSSLKEYHFALVEDGAEIAPAMRPASLQLNSPPQKPKKHRKTLSTSSAPHNVTSPMRNFSRYLAMGGLSIASGSYSPAKETLRREVVPASFTATRRDALISLDDSALVLAKYSPSAGGDSFDSSWHQKVWKMMQKGSRRSGEETASGERMDDDEASSVRPRTQRVERFRHPVLLPDHFDRELTSCSESVSSCSRDSTASDDDGLERFRYAIPEDDAFSPSAAVKSMTFPRNSSTPSSVDSTWSRRGAIRKHHSHHGAIGTYRQISENDQNSRRDADKTSSESDSGPLVQRQESRSKFYVVIDGGVDVIPRPSSSHSMEPIREIGTQARPRSKIYHRASSDPCILESKKQSRDDVFEEPDKPRITIESPSPKKSASKADWVAAASRVSANDIATGDVIQDDVTSPVETRSRSSTGESETTYL